MIQSLTHRLFDCSIYTSCIESEPALVRPSANLLESPSRNAPLVTLSCSEQEGGGGRGRKKKKKRNAKPDGAEGLSWVEGLDLAVKWVRRHVRSRVVWSHPRSRCSRSVWIGPVLRPTVDRVWPGFLTPGGPWGKQRKNGKMEKCGWAYAGDPTHG